MYIKENQNLKWKLFHGKEKYLLYLLNDYKEIYNENYWCIQYTEGNNVHLHTSINWIHIITEKMKQIDRKYQSFFIKRISSFIISWSVDTKNCWGETFAWDWMPCWWLSFTNNKS